VDRAGHEVGAVGVDGGYRSVRLSPDGQTVVFDRFYPPTDTQDVWTLRLDRNLETRLTSDPGSEAFPVWMPEGRGVVFMADRGGAPHLFRKDTATGADDQLLPPGQLQQPEDVSAAGDVVFVERTERGNYDVRMLHAGDRSVSVLFNSPFDEQQPRLSPDNRAIAVLSDESGRYELYVTSFPPQGAKVSVSAGGASAPRWAPDGRELFYPSADGHLMAVPARTHPALEVGVPMPLFALTATARWKDFDVARDGKKFLAIIPQSRANEQPLTVVVNWQAGLAAR
jgi:Tol biopolymer transport system component